MSFLRKMFSGKVTTEEMSAPTSTAGTRSMSRPCACERWVTVQLTAPAKGTHNATSEPASCPPETWAAYM